jgi:uncharacterized membrane protein YjgN (DUF898 family)
LAKGIEPATLHAPTESTTNKIHKETGMSADPSQASADRASSQGTGAATATRIERFTFTGSGGEYFRIWIVNLLLSILTLGIYSAWAKVRRMRYFYGNTRLAGSVFEYHGQPIQILKGRLIAFGVVVFFAIMASVWPLTDVLFVIVLLLGTPWIIVKARTFQMRVSSYRNIRFNFRQDYGDAARIFIGMALLIPLTLWLLYPYWSYRRFQFAITNTSFGTSPFGFLAGPGVFYRIYALGALLWIPALVVVFLFFTAVAGSTVSDADIQHARRLAALVPSILLMVVLSYLVVSSYLQNASLGNAVLGAHRLVSAVQFLTLLGIYLANTLLIILTLGLYLPWAQVRLARYRFECLALELRGSLDEFVADQQTQVAAAGEELGELLDVDLGL